MLELLDKGRLDKGNNNGGPILFVYLMGENSYVNPHVPKLTPISCCTSNLRHTCLRDRNYFARKFAYLPSNTPGVDSSGYTTQYDPFRYRIYSAQTRSPAEAQQFCLRNGALLAVGYPGKIGKETLRTFAYGRDPSWRVFLGITLAANLTNGTLLFMTQRGEGRNVHGPKV
jgi:hypothetical protein